MSKSIAIEAAEVYKALREKGEIKSNLEPSLYEKYIEYTDDVKTLAKMDDCEVFARNSRVHLIPEKDSPLCKRSMVDLFSQVGAKNFYLCRYYAIFVLLFLYGGTSQNLTTRDKFTEAALMEAFDAHCIESLNQIDEETDTAFGFAFTQSAHSWLAKISDGTKSGSTREGITNAVLTSFFKANKPLFCNDAEKTWSSTQRLGHLIHYCLRDPRVEEIPEIMAKGGT